MCKLSNKERCKQYYKTHKERWKKYRGKRSKLYYSRFKLWYATYKKTLKCSLCEENHPACLDFHHIDPSTKIARVSALATLGYSVVRVKAEMDKCIVLCSNCHRKEHYVP